MLSADVYPASRALIVFEFDGPGHTIMVMLSR